MATREDEDSAGPADATRPSIARVYDYLLGGTDNFDVDRGEAERMIQRSPSMPALVRENRLFLSRAVGWLARQGIRQFLDIGSGLPTARNTHQVAQDADPACRVVYADNDPAVVARAQALLAGPGWPLLKRTCVTRPPCSLPPHGPGCSGPGNPSPSSSP